MALTTHHRHKRAFQPQITSYFAREDRDDVNAAGREDARIPLQGPRLEHQVQASLLSVGMRIRKAVPEGYKTHKTSLFHDPTPAKGYVAGGGAAARPRELLPYCGLLDVGGLRPPVDAQAEIDIYADEMPFNLSQESNTSSVSTDSAPARPQAQLPIYNWNKRRFEDEENENLFPPDEGEGERVEQSFAFNLPTDGVIAAGFTVDLPVSPRRAFPISHTTMPDLGAISEARPMATPRSRRRGAGSALVEPVAQVVDFEEADFLVPWDDVDMDGA